MKHFCFSVTDRSYEGGRYKDEATDSHHHHHNNNDDSHRQPYTPTSESSFQHHVNKLDERFGQTYNARHKGRIEI
jgi:hypothetical protein